MATALKSNPRYGDVVWGLVIALFIPTMYYERALFSYSFVDLLDYLTLIVSWIIITGLITWLSPKLTPKIISYVLILCMLVLALVWFTFAFQLPENPPDDTVCISRACLVAQAQYSYCSNWSCQFPGQILLFICNFCILFPLLTLWRRDNGFKIMESTKIHTLFLSAGYLIVLGLAESIKYYYVAYLVGLTWIVLAFVILKSMGSLQNPNTPLKNHRDPIETSFDILNILQGLSDLLIMAAIALFGFSLVKKLS